MSRRDDPLSPSFLAVDGLLTGTANLLLMADLHDLDRQAGHRRAVDLLEQIDVAYEAGKPAAAYSGEVPRRLDLAITLVGAASRHFPG